jgi:hypothetical protein
MDPAIATPPISNIPAPVSITAVYAGNRWAAMAPAVPNAMQIKLTAPNIAACRNIQ